MAPVTFPLKTGDDNENVINLKSALQFLIAKKIIDTTDGPQLIDLMKGETGFKDGTKKTLALFQQAHQLTPSGIVDEATAVTLNKVLTKFDAFDGNTQPSVEGYIYMDYGLPADSVKLRLYSKGFGGMDTVVTETTTDGHGKYNFAFSLANIPEANLEVRALDAAGKEHLLSSTLFNVGKKDTISNLNLIAPTEVKPVAESEFIRLSRDVAGVIGDISKLKNAAEKGERQDITLLSQNTNWDARLLALASLAGKLSETIQLSHEAAYALVRSGLPTEADQLAQINSDDISQALEIATKSGIVNLTDDQKKTAIAEFQTFANKNRLSTKGFNAISTYDNLLTMQQFSDSEKSAFADVYFAPRKDATELWQKAKAAGIADDKIKGLQLQGKLGMLTANNGPLIQNLQGAIGNAGNLSKLVEEGLYESDTWDKKLKSIAGTNDDNAEALDKLIPPAYIGRSISERKQAYTMDMAVKVRLAFPEIVLRHRIESGELKIKDSASQIGVANFMKKAEDLGYKLGSTHLDSFVEKNGSSVFNGVSADQKTSAINGVKLITRIYQVTPNDEAMQVLLELGHSAAQDIVAVPREDFITRFAKEYSDKYRMGIDEGIRIAQQIYNKSQQVYTTTYSFFTASQMMQQTPAVFAISGDAKKQAAEKQSLAEKIKGAPNLQQLFGSLDFCECEHCRSVLSPAAYLVDLLQFLDRKETDWHYFLDKWKTDHAGEDYEVKYSKPYDALIDRRPDIINLPLTCENTNTALPYIDIVNEILEYYLVNKKLTIDTAHDTGNATTPELLAEPQNVEPKAYGTLKQALYPLTLPFDLWIETVRQFCSQYEIPLYKVIDTMQPIVGTDFATQRKIAVESLNISPGEYALFTREDPIANLFGLYGYANDAEMTAGLKSAKQLANRLGVSYKELLALVQTQFVNPQLSSMVLLQKMSVQITDLFRYKKAVGFAAFTEDETQAFEEKLARVKEMYGTDAKAFIDQAWNDGVFKQILLLNDTNAGCNFDATIVGYADRDALKFDWLKFNLFVRLWKKLGWTIAETDVALNVLMPQNLRSVYNDPSKDEKDRAKVLAQALDSVLINIAHLQKLTSEVNVGKGAIIKLGTLWADIPTTGTNSLYSQLFLSRNVLKIDPVFDDALGQYVSKDVNIKDGDKDHSIAIQAALNITAGDLEKILKDNGQEIATAKLSLANLSLLYRYAILAKALKLPVADLIMLKQLSGLDPFTPLFPNALQASGEDHFLNQTIRFAELVMKMKNSGFKLEDVTYLFQHRFDATGKYRNVESGANATVQLIANAIALIQTQYAVPANPSDANDVTPFAAFTDDVLEEKLALVVSPSATQAFMAMWTGRQAVDWEIIKNDFKDFFTKEKFDPLFVPGTANADDSTKQKSLLQKRAVLARALLPFIQNKLTSQSTIQILSTTTTASPSIIEWFISDASHLNNTVQPGVPLLQLFSEANDTPKAIIARNAIILLNKTLQLVQGLQLSDQEIQYFVLNAKDFNNFDLSKMPVEDNNTLANVQGLFSSFIRLYDYTTLRQSLASSGVDLIELFENARLSYDSDSDIPATQLKHLKALYQQMANLTRRDFNLVANVGSSLGINSATHNVDGKVLVSVEAFADERGILALWNALQLVHVFGIPAATLIDSTQIINTGLTEEKYQSIAENFKNAVKARYELEAWQQIAQPVFNKLRQLRRNALVAYLLHNFSNLFSSMEEMYEYFLVDPGTEPVVQTSRIRIATASVQLFIQRCLLNLENRWNKKVSPVAINVKHWQWMNRYRVWEANRKIFLWPENWLEPEWRDDKTHLFTELEGKLLQGDVSNDLVEDAFYTYLQKLEELARLDIVTMYCEENAVTPEANTLHVIGRTYGFPHKYFYRKYAQKIWTPWQPVDAEIDGDHIVTAIWRGRLHILWVTFIEKIEGNNSLDLTNNGDSATLPDTTLANWKVAQALGTIPGGAQQKTIEVHLHWSELYQGQWTTKKSAGPDNSISKTVSHKMNINDISITIAKEPNISDQLDGPLRISLGGLGGFRLINKNSPPEIISPDNQPAWKFTESEYYINRLRKNVDVDNSKLAISYERLIRTLDGSLQDMQADPQTILGNTMGKFNLVPCSIPVTMRGAESGPLITPFFYQDSWHTFYVEPTLTENTTIDQWNEWVDGPSVVNESSKTDWDRIKLKPYHLHSWFNNAPVPKNLGDLGRMGISSSSRIQALPLSQRDWLTGGDTYLLYGERVIGQDAGMDLMLVNRDSNSIQLVKEASQLNSVIHNINDVQNIVLVPADKVNGISDKTLQESSLLKDSISAKTNVVLVGSAGIILSQMTNITHSSGGIFIKNISVTKKFNN